MFSVVKSMSAEFNINSIEPGYSSKLHLMKVPLESPQKSVKNCVQVFWTWTSHSLTTRQIWNPPHAQFGGPVECLLVHLVNRTCHELLERLWFKNIIIEMGKNVSERHSFPALEISYSLSFRGSIKYEWIECRAFLRRRIQYRPRERVLFLERKISLKTWLSEGSLNSVWMQYSVLAWRVVLSYMDKALSFKVARRLDYEIFSNVKAGGCSDCVIQSLCLCMCVLRDDCIHC